MESVRRYVIIPTVPCPLMSTPSYNCCAIRIVFCVEKFKVLAASCCNVLVVKGSGAFLTLSLFLISSTAKSQPSRSFIILLTSSSLPIVTLPLLSDVNLAVTGFFIPSILSIASIVQYSSGIKALISSSLSQIILKATDCTRPAESPRFIFAHNKGLIL